MAKQKPRTLSGFMELLPRRQQQFERMAELLRQSYALYGFAPLDTPIIEASEVLLAKGGGETEKQIYRFTKGDSDLSLRFDLTVPLAKYVALHYAELSFPFRRFQIGKVYRGERAQRGRFREFYQADIDVIGDGKLDIVNEAEIPAIICRTFTALGLERFQIRVNNRKLLSGFYAMLGLTDRAIMDFTDVAQERCTLDTAAVEHPDLPRLFLLTAPARSRGRPVTDEQMAALLEEARERFDYCFLDAPAGLDSGFQLATCAADRAVVVATADASSLRDAQHTVMELHRFPTGKLHLVVNRVRKKMLRSMHATIDDAIDRAGLPLIGVIPEDDSLPLSLNKGVPLLLSSSQGAAAAYRNIAQRLEGERVPLLRIR